MKHATRIAVLGALVAGAATVAAVAAQSSPGFNLRRFVVAGGGGRAASAGFTLHGTLGQAETGGSTGPGLRLSGGFWWPAVVATPTATPTPAVQSTRTPTATSTLTSPNTRTATATPTPVVQPTRTATASPTPTVQSTLAATRTTTPSPGPSSTVAPSPTPAERVHVWLPIAMRRWVVASP